MRSLSFTPPPPLAPYHHTSFYLLPPSPYAPPTDCSQFRPDEPICIPVFSWAPRYVTLHVSTRIGTSEPYKFNAKLLVNSCWEENFLGCLRWNVRRWLWFIHRRFWEMLLDKKGGLSLQTYVWPDLAKIKKGLFGKILNAIWKFFIVANSHIFPLIWFIYSFTVTL